MNVLSLDKPEKLNETPVSSMIKSAHTAYDESLAANQVWLPPPTNTVEIRLTYLFVQSYDKFPFSNLNKTTGKFFDDKIKHTTFL